jgi:hypothetical protein
LDLLVFCVRSGTGKEIEADRAEAKVHEVCHKLQSITSPLIEFADEAEEALLATLPSSPSMPIDFTVRGTSSDTTETLSSSNAHLLKLTHTISYDRPIVVSTN